MRGGLKTQVRRPLGILKFCKSSFAEAVSMVRSTENAVNSA